MLVPDGPGRLVPVGAGEQAHQAAERVEAAAGDAVELTTAVERRALVDLADDLHRLRDVLVALGFDSTVSSRLRGAPEDFPAVVTAEVEDAATRQLEAERQVLEGAFGSVQGATVLQIPDRDPFLSSIAGHQWLITVPPEGWEEVTGVAVNLERRLVDVPVSIACEVADQLLPIAVRLSHSFESNMLPLSPEVVSEFASMIGKETVSGPSLEHVSAVVRELSLASWEHSRLQLRPVSWPHPGGSPGTRLETAQELIGGMEAAPDGLVGPLRSLHDRVAAEIAGTQHGPPVAAELSGVDVFDTADLAESHAITLATSAVLAALDVELLRAIAE